MFFQIFCPVPLIRSSRSRLLNILICVYSFVLLCYPVCIFLKMFFFDRAFQGLDITSTVIMCLITLMCLTHFCIIVQTISTRYKHQLTIDLLHDTDTLFRECFQVRHIHLSTIFTIQILVLVAILIILYGYFIFFILINDSYFPIFVSIVVIRMRCLQMVYYVALVHERISKLNEQLQILSIHFDDSVRTKYSIQLVKTIYYEKINTLKCIYAQTCRVSKLINACFGWSFLIITTEFFIEIVAIGYIAFLFWYLNFIGGSAAHELIGITPAAITFIFVCFACNKCSEKVSMYFGKFKINY